MKKITFSFLLIIITICAFPQAVLQHTFSDQGICGLNKLQNGNWVYAAVSSVSMGSEIYLYNQDFTLLYNIPLQLPPDCFLDRIYNVSDNLFNLDNDIEILFGVHMSPSDITLFLINQNGTILQEFPHQSYTEIKNIDGEFKMICFASIYDPNTYVYSLPGTMVNIAEQDPMIQGSSAFPNPCNTYIDINCPISATLLTVYNQLGIELYRTSVNPSKPVRVNTSNMPAGTYIYEIQVSNNQRESGKFTIVK